MSAHTIHVLSCDATPPGLDLCDTRLAGKHWMTETETREMASRCGWSITPGRDVCPTCVADT